MEDKYLFRAKRVVGEWVVGGLEIWFNWQRKILHCP